MKDIYNISATFKNANLSLLPDEDDESGSGDDGGSGSGSIDGGS